MVSAAPLGQSVGLVGTGQVVRSAEHWVTAPTVHWVVMIGQVVGMGPPAGHSVSFTGHEVITIGQFVGSSGGHCVISFGHWVALTGHSVVTAGQLVPSFGQLVTTRGHVV